MHKHLAVAVVTALSVGMVASRPAWAAPAGVTDPASTGQQTTREITIAGVSGTDAPQLINAALDAAAARTLNATAQVRNAGAATARQGSPPPGGLPIVSGPSSPDGAPPPTSSDDGSSSPATNAAMVAGPVIQSGIATWYGPGFVGSVTYCGEVFDQWAMTAASNTLPCGTQIVVTNQNTGRSVTVRITDRGGFGGAVILDLSQGAFDALGGPPAGTIPVTVQLAQ